MTFVKNAIIKKPTARALCFAAGRAARGVRHRRMHLARTRVKLIPLLYRSSCKWARGRPLWRVITPYRYKDRVSCHSGNEPVVVVVVLPLSFSFFSCYAAKNAVYRFHERLGKGQNVHGSLSLLSEDPIPSGWLACTLSVISVSLIRCGLRAWWIHPEVDVVERSGGSHFTPPIVPHVLFRIMSLLINIAGFEKSLSPFSICARFTRCDANHSAKSILRLFRQQLKPFWLSKADDLSRELHNYLYMYFTWCSTV